MSCSPELIQSHSQLLGEHASAIMGLREDVNRHEKVYDILLGMSSTQSQMLHEIKTQGEVLKRVVDDVDYLKENSETKATVTELQKEVQNLKEKDGREAEKLLKQLRWLIISLFVSGVAGLVWNVVAS